MYVCEQFIHSFIYSWQARALLICLLPLTLLAKFVSRYSTLTKVDMWTRFVLTFLFTFTGRAKSRLKLV